MQTWITCPRCGGRMYAGQTKENGITIYNGFECTDCFKRIITSDMTFQEMLSVTSSDYKTN